MAEKSSPKATPKTAFIALAVGTVILAALGGWLVLKPKPASMPAMAGPDQSALPVRNQPVIDYGQLEKDKALDAMMAQRKADYGIQKGVDMIVRSDETLKIGDETVSMKELHEKIRLKEGRMIETDIGTGAAAIPASAYGIHVVQDGDNIWNIHFRLLREYFTHKGIVLSPQSDEPDLRGYSSGVGKVLKFSENMVYIYQVRERQFSDDLNMIRPLSKIVVYNMDRVFALLDQIDDTRVNRIQFDGENLWIPAEQ
ncbi:MAG: hypothetical protein JEZ11_09615 [Desulfobacterales bacterium]|nr:hypothetical protein [Desulfobacterales bacterium]